MQTTEISWADYSWNPQTGCSRAGPICFDPETGQPKCYAETFFRRQANREDTADHVTDAEWTVENASEVVDMHPDRLEEPKHYGYPEGPGTVFVGSMTDMFHHETDPGFVQRALDVCRQRPECLFIWLTKRPQRAADWRLDWPSNTMLGVSVGSSGNKYPSTTHRIEQLRDVDVDLKWVSFEPLLEPIGEVALDHIDWMVVGGESDPNADTRREMEHAWARALLAQAREEDIPFFFKQSSGSYPEQRTRLTVENEQFGVFEQRRIREEAPTPACVEAARGEAMVADGGVSEQ